ncbi:hypothetical protein TNCV_1619121 [Trichonephila clavipes]|nr:hypothetical protein TNCV_1619121 [Trichonephila clavipes]
MAPRTIDAAVVQKDSLRVDELLSKLVSLEEPLASLKLQRKVQGSSPHQNQRSRSRSKSRRRYKPRTEKPDVNSLWIAKQTSRSSLGQKRKEKLLPSKKIIISAWSLEPPSISTCLTRILNLTKPNLVYRVVKHGVKHHILTTDQPVYSKARQLVPDKLKLATQEFHFILYNDIVRFSKSQRASPLHLVNKKDGTLRPCADYRRLNAQTIPDQYPIPRIEDFNYILKDKKIFSKIDLVKAYYQIPITEEDKEKTSITTPFGLYEFNTMSFGLRNAPSTFQRFITEVMYGLDFVFPYLDDVLVASSTEEEHSEQLKMVFERFQEYGLRINVSKSVMGADQVEYLGFLITAEGSRPLPEKVQAILNYKLPETIHDLRTFLGMINFYRRYLKDAAKTQAPLHELLKGVKKDRRKVLWTEDTRRSFEKCKTDLAEAALLSFPRSGLPLSLCTDTSDFLWGSTPAVRKRGLEANSFLL